MNEIKLKVTERIAEIKPVQVEKERKLIGQMLKKPNMIVFRACLKSGDVTKAPMELIVNHLGKKTHLVNVEEGFIYCYALNGKNAVKKFERRIYGSLNR
jgi:hypothetical protein